MRKHILRFACLIIALLLIAASVNGCAMSRKIKLDPKNPVTISIWHYYNGAIMNSFDAAISEFNRTVGMEEGIIVEGFGHGSVSELERAVVEESEQSPQERNFPNIFLSYGDIALSMKNMGLVADLSKYFTEEDQSLYVESYIEEGRIGNDGELAIFPIAKATEVLMLNETDWSPFAQANNLSTDDLVTMEGVTRVAQIYFEWTDAKTPEIEGDGKAFFGRDAMANLFILSSKEFSIELFEVNEGNVTINIDEGVMRKIWDNYYVPYISGYFLSHGKFRSDDAKVGDILAYVGSTASASYFPEEVTIDGVVRPISSQILPVPHFEDGNEVVVQQGAGAVVSAATVQEEYASVIFLKWFTEAKQNMKFAADSGYLPVKREANEYDFIVRLEQDGIIQKTMQSDRIFYIATRYARENKMYNNKAFEGGSGAREVVEYNLHNKAVQDRKIVAEKVENGASLKDVVAQLNTDTAFKEWLEDFTKDLEKAIK